MSFFLVTLEPDGKGNMVDVPIPDYGPYEKGSEAAKYAKVLTEQMGRKVQPRRIAQAADWRGRQAQRLADGTLMKLPAKWDLAPIKDHFAHLDANDPSKIAFTENDELGVIDRVTILTPGRYLTRFYPEVNDDHRRKLIAAIDPSGEIFFATTPEQIVHVYKTGPRSCMDDRHNFDELPEWPTAPYGAGDLAIAYTMNSQRRIQSRCMCWPAEKLFGRCYGDIQRLEAAMKSEGYDHLRGHTPFKKFVGAKLLKIPTGDPGEYVMPYFDDIILAHDNGDHFITALEKPEGKIGAKYIQTGGQAGYAAMYEWCPKLKDFYPEYQFKLVNGVNERWSREAVLQFTSTCEATGDRWPTDMLVELENGDRVNPEWAKSTNLKPAKPKAKRARKGARQPEPSLTINGTRADFFIIDDVGGQQPVNVNIGDAFDLHAVSHHEPRITIGDVEIDRAAVQEFLSNPSLMDALQQQQINRMARRIDDAVAEQLMGQTTRPPRAA